MFLISNSRYQVQKSIQQEKTILKNLVSLYQLNIKVQLHLKKCHTFIINLKENIIEKLSEQADNSKTPLNVLFSTLTLSIIFQVITIIFAYLNTSANSNVITYIINSFALLSLFSLFDIALNLFCIHTYFKK